MVDIERRGFLAGTIAGAFSLGWAIPDAAAQAVAKPVALGIWAVIHPDDAVVVRIARSEMGQGTLTGLAQLVADELDADWSRVRWEYVKPEDNFASKRAWGDMLTGGSRGIRTSVDYVRQGGAAARAMLVQAAAQRWNVPASECRTSESMVTHTASKRTLRYGELAEAASRLPVPTAVKLKTPAEWTIIGKPVPRLDTAEKLDGSQKYAIDVMLPGMKNAAIAQCPVFGGTLTAFDAAAAQAMPGVRHVVKVGDNAVAVVADSWWQAKTALEAVKITWEEGANAGVTSAMIAERLKAGLDATDAAVGHKIGDAPAVLAKAGRTIVAEYGSPFLNHATLEPMNCTALVTANQVEVWVGTQNGDATLAAAAEAAELPVTSVRVNKMMLGGGFGRRGFQDYTRQAVQIAKQVPGVPVKLIWSREEDMQHGLYRPITQCRLTASLTDKGELEALHMRLSGQSIIAYLSPSRIEKGYDALQFQGLLADEFGYLGIPNLLIDHAMRNTHVPVGFWRGVNHNQNAVYLECFMDELAHAAGRDPLEFRRSLMAKNPKHLAVLNAAAEKAGWGTPTAPGVFRGLCQNNGFGSYTAAVAEVSVSKAGDVTIHRIVAATDPGTAVNPDQIRAQVEGSFVYGLSAALYSENTIDKGRVVEGNFDTYEVMRLAAMPKVETVLMPSGGFWGGVGEPTIAVAAPAVLNAIFAATGKRVRSLPIKGQDLRAA